MKAKKFIKSRKTSAMMPFKVLTILLYSYPKGMTLVKGTTILSTPEFCRGIGIMKCRLLEHLEELERLMIIDKFTINGSIVKFDIAPPMGYTIEVEEEERV